MSLLSDRLPSLGWDSTRHSVVDMRRVRTLATVALMLVLIGIPFLIRAIEWHVTLRIWTVSFAMCSGLLTLLILRLRRDASIITPLSHWLSLGVLVILVGGVATGGGSSSVNQGSLVILPLLAGVVNGQKSAMLWGLVALLAILTVGALENFGWHFGNLTPEEYRHSQFLLQATGTVLAVLGILAGFFSQLSQSEAQLSEQNQQLQRQIGVTERAMEDVRSAELAKTRFLGNMSHELRTPLNIILGFSRRLEKSLRDRLDEREASSLSTIVRSSASMQQLVDDLFDLSALDTGHLVLQHNPLELTPLLQSLERKLESELTHWNSSLTLALAEPLTLHSDGRRLEQVLVTLVRFALKHSPGTQLLLRVQRGAGERIEFHFMDNAPLLGADTVARLFDRYNHLHSWQERDTGISGLGMALAALLVQLLGGELICSPSQQGNRFHFSLPAGTQA